MFFRVRAATALLPKDEKKPAGPVKVAG